MSDSAIEKPNLLRHYEEKAVPALKERLNLPNVMQLPRVESIVLNMGAGDASQDKKIATVVQEHLTAIAGQKAVLTRARKSVAGFKIREGWPVGSKVTLRGARMYEFMERLLSIALPATRDFRGLSPKSFDGRGNYSFGIRENIIFPELDFDTIDKVRGLDIVITTSAKTNAEALELLKAMNFPFRGQAKAS